MGHMLNMIPILLAIVIAEILVSHRRDLRSIDVKDSVASIVLGIGSVVIGNLIGLTLWFIILFGVYEFRFMTLENGLFTWLLGYVLYDKGLYWSHRWMHRIRFFWATHVVHHSSTRFNFATAVRQPLTSSVFEVLPLLPIPLLGFGPEMMLSFHTVNLLYQLLLHTEAVRKLPRAIEYVMNTPSHHRVHHSSEQRYLDRNYGCTFIIWDRLFNTFKSEEDEPVIYGLTKNVESNNPVTIALHEWRNILSDLVHRSRTPAECFMYVFGPPGWVPKDRDGAPVQALPACLSGRQGQPPGTPSKTPIHAGDTSDHHTARHAGRDGGEGAPEAPRQRTKE